MVRNSARTAIRAFFHVNTSLTAHPRILRHFARRLAQVWQSLKLKKLGCPTSRGFRDVGLRDRPHPSPDQPDVQQSGSGTYLLGQYVLYLFCVVLSVAFLTAGLAGVGLVAAAGFAVVAADDRRAALLTAP